MNLDFFVKTVTFSGKEHSILTTQVEHTFDTDIRKGNVALQSIHLAYDD